MNEETDLAPVDVENPPDPGELPGIIALLGELKPGAVLFEEGLARLFDRHPASIKRAVQRGELPPPCRLFGGNAWTAGVLVRHVEKRLEEAAREAEKLAQKLAKLSP
jgi:hypothetical protein